MGLKLGEWVKYRNIRLEMLLSEYETNIYKHYVSKCTGETLLNNQRKSKHHKM